MEISSRERIRGYRCGIRETTRYTNPKAQYQGHNAFSTEAHSTQGVSCIVSYKTYSFTSFTFDEWVIRPNNSFVERLSTHDPPVSNDLIRRMSLQTHSTNDPSFVVWLIHRMSHPTNNPVTYHSFDAWLIDPFVQSTNDSFDEWVIRSSHSPKRAVH